MNKLMIKLYLDIDGVLLTAKQTRPADYSVEFIEFITGNFDCYWLTTHCKGDSNSAISYLSKYFDDKVIEKLKKVKPTNWTTLKTEAIDFSSDFFWLDDYPFQDAIDVLTKHSKNDRLIVVDLKRKEELKRVILNINKFL
jgi:hypothetical protein